LAPFVARDWRHADRRAKCGDNQLLLDLIEEDSWRINVYAGELEVRPPGAPTDKSGAMVAIWNDVRLAARSLRKAAGFTSLAVLVLAVGIGATSIIFSLIDATFLRPLPYRDPQLVMRVTSPFAARWGQIPSRSSAGSSAKVRCCPHSADWSA
jgi:hypothetical protein